VPALTILAVDSGTTWLRPDGMPGAADDAGAKQVRRVSIQLDVTGSSKRSPSSALTVIVPEPYSQAALIKAAKAAIASLPDRHPDEGTTLAVPS
jgi:hypothetical protein